MELEVSVSEAMALIKEVENVPAKILEYTTVKIQKRGDFSVISFCRTSHISWQSIADCARKEL